MNEWGPGEWTAIIMVGFAIIGLIVRAERRAGTFVTREEMLKAAEQVKAQADIRLDKQDKMLEKIGDRIEVNFSEARKEWNKESDFRHTIASTVAAMGAKLEVIVQRDNNK